MAAMIVANAGWDSIRLAPDWIWRVALWKRLLFSGAYWNAFTNIGASGVAITVGIMPKLRAIPVASYHGFDRCSSRGALTCD
jgi:hypothetical protein